MTTPPTPNPSIVMVKASETSARLAANSPCTVGSTTTTDHMPTLPTVPISSARPSRRQAAAESGTKAMEVWEAAGGIARGHSSPIA